MTIESFLFDRRATSSSYPDDQSSPHPPDAYFPPPPKASGICKHLSLPLLESSPPSFRARRIRLPLALLYTVTFSFSGNPHRRITPLDLEISISAPSLSVATPPEEENFFPLLVFVYPPLLAIAQLKALSPRI